MTRNLFVSLSIALILTISAIGCSDSGTTTENKPVTPKAGTTYTYTQHRSDTTNSVPFNPTDSERTALVLLSGSSFGGKTNVIIQWEDTTAQNNDTMRYVIESNGDISIYNPSFGTSVAGQRIDFINPTPWLQIPFGSKSTGVQLFAMDTAITLPLVGKQTLHIVATADYIGTEDLQVNNQSLANGGKAMITITISNPLLPAPVVAKQIYSYDPSLGGYFHSISTLSVPAVITFPQSHTLTERTLVSYHLVK
jgi:hypothetical protein